jgi:hypothetical protein
MWALRVKRIIPEQSLNDLYEFLSRGKITEAMVISRTNGSAIARIALAFDSVIMNLTNLIDTSLNLM